MTRKSLITRAPSAIALAGELNGPLAELQRRGVARVNNLHSFDEVLDEMISAGGQVTVPPLARGIADRETRKVGELVRSDGPDLMRFRVLGPLEIWSGADWTGISANKWRVLLACLLLKSPQVVSIDALIVELWGDAPPLTASNLVSIYVTQLRRALGDVDARLLIRRNNGYQLNASPGDTDLQRFEPLVARGREALAAGAAETAGSLLAEAEGLWRGRFLADVPQSVLVAAESERVTELRLSATELRITASLACDQYAETIPELRRLVSEHPLREGLWLLLMRALRGAGRHAESLSVYSQARLVISRELGVDPGPELQQFHAEMLRTTTPRVSAPQRPAEQAAGATGALTDSAGAQVDEASPQAPARRVKDTRARPAQLPADVADFSGRQAQVAYLRDTLTSHQVADGPGAVRIAVVTGAAGVGKTTLAVRVAHQVQGLFPDGQLYVDLCGACDEPLAPRVVLARFLADLGTGGGEIPEGEQERAAVFRTQLTGQRVLIVLDNAKDAVQLRPLLPGTASCAVLVTTRQKAPYLVSTGFMDLDTLSEPEALEMLSRIVGYDRVTAEPDATAELLEICAGLPLAIRICAARLATRPRWRIATMADRLRNERRRLDELQVGDLEVRASFRASYDSLEKSRCRVDPARAFRLLGIWRGQKIALAAAAALLGEPETDVADTLETLVDMNLLESPAPDWYQFHDLLRLFAAERAQASEAEKARLEALTRLLQWYLKTATTTAEALSPYRYRIPHEKPRGPLVLPNSAKDSLAWYENEKTNLIDAIGQARAAGLHDVAWRLSTTLFPFFNRRANWDDCITANRIAVNSARADEDRYGEAWALQNLGFGLSKTDQLESFARLEEALAIRRELGDLNGQAQTLIALADTHFRLRGAVLEVHMYSFLALEILRQADSPVLLAVALNNHGEFCRALGRLDEATECYQESLSISRALGTEEYVRGNALENLGRIHLEAGRLSEAIADLAESHRLQVASGQMMGQAVALKLLGHAQRASGQADRARESLAKALIIFDDLGITTEVQAIRSDLADRRAPAVD
jgi:DNA-binding SARP family transcriptional activator/tetratricopeptide (TPR) repeat protein